MTSNSRAQRSDLAAARAEAWRCRGDLARAHTGFESAMALVPARDAVRRAAILDKLGVVQRQLGRAQAARRSHSRALRCYVRARRNSGAAAALDNLGILARHQGDVVAARAYHRRALVFARRAGDRSVEGNTRLSLAMIDQRLGHLDRARREYANAQRALEAVGEIRTLGIVKGRIGLLLQEKGAWAAAARRYDDSDVLWQRSGDRRLRSFFLAYRATLHLERGALEPAVRDADHALDHCPTGRQRVSVRILGCCASVLAVAGRIDEAGSLAARAVARAAAPGLRAAAGLHECHVALCAGRIRADQARALLRECGASPTVHERLAGRLLRSALPAALVVHRDGEWIALPDGTTVDLARRGPMRRLLLRLAEHRCSSPGHALSWQMLFQAGWPDEPVSPQTASLRVRVAVNSLRRLGLRGYLQTTADGYRLDPGIDCSVESA